jgi:shikimate dehydrogenase
MSDDGAPTLPRIFGVFGHPIAHSRSPAMHAAAFSALGEPHRYLAFDVRPKRLGDALRGAAALGFGGVNLTVPHKQAALEIVDRVSPETQRCGAVNTVAFEDGAMIGHSTDGAGFLAGLAELGTPPNAKALVLGGGGAARSVVDALLHTKTPFDVAWVSRSPHRLPRWRRVQPLGWGSLERGLAGVGLVINATTVGMAGGPGQFPRPLDLGPVHDRALVVDLVYPKPPRGLPALAKARKLGYQDGLAMLVFQGALAQRAWRGRPMPDFAIKAMRAAIA